VKGYAGHVTNGLNKEVTMIENILILDTETTGLDPNKGAKVIEIGAILYNVKNKVAVQTLSTFLRCETNEAQHINHIEPAWTQARKEELGAIKFLGLMARQASFIVAHYAQFDKKFMDTIPTDSHFEQMKWVCTKKDFKWPMPLIHFRLEDICKALSVPYVDAHRALIDCSFLASCFSKVIDLEQRLEDAARGSMNNRFR
jgi:DNA polymerase-3 subunit epsilon